MQKDRRFLVVLVTPGHGTGMDITVKPDQIVRYSGDVESVRVGTPSN